MDGSGLAVRWEARKSLGAASPGQRQTMVCINSGSGGGKEFEMVLEKPRTRGYIFHVGSGEWRVIPSSRVHGGAICGDAHHGAGSGFGAVGEGFGSGTW